MKMCDEMKITKSKLNNQHIDVKSKVQRGSSTSPAILPFHEQPKVKEYLAGLYH